MGGGKAAAQWILTQPAKSERRQLPLLLPTLLLLKPLLLLTSQMATLGLTPTLGPGTMGPGTMAGTMAGTMGPVESTQSLCGLHTHTLAGGGGGGGSWKVWRHGTLLFPAPSRYPALRED